MQETPDPPVRMEICREYEFDAAHHLEWHPGACRNMHGHTYRLEVVVTGDVDSRGVVMDFAELDAVVKTNVLAEVDHRLLNDLLDNPTAEHIALWIWQTLQRKTLTVSEIKLWETRRSSVRITTATAPLPQ